MGRCVLGHAGVLSLVGMLAGAPVGVAGEAGATVTGSVRIEGEPPAPREWELDEAMQRATGEKSYREETWQVGPEKGLAHCVITLEPKMPAATGAIKPMETAVLDRIGVRYVPRVLVVTPGTEVVLRNEASPCRGFQITGKPRLGHEFNYLVREGTERKITMRGPDTCPVSCPIRPYARGYIIVVSTPYFAVTDTKGSFTIRELPTGTYKVAVWHEGVGKLNKAAGPTEVTVLGADNSALSFRVTPRTDRDR